MGQIANQMALELFFKIKERIKEKKKQRQANENNGPKEQTTSSLLNLSYHNAKAFATGTANRKFCVFARKQESCGELRPPDLRKRQMSRFDKRPSGVSAARKAR